MASREGPPKILLEELRRLRDVLELRGDGSLVEFRADAGLQPVLDVGPFLQNRGGGPEREQWINGGRAINASGVLTRIEAFVVQQDTIYTNVGWGVTEGATEFLSGSIWIERPEPGGTTPIYVSDELAGESFDPAVGTGLSWFHMIPSFRLPGPFYLPAGSRIRFTLHTSATSPNTNTQARWSERHVDSLLKELGPLPHE